MAIGDLVRPVAAVRSVPMHSFRLILYLQLIFPIYNPFFLSFLSFFFFIDGSLSLSLPRLYLLLNSLYIVPRRRINSRLFTFFIRCVLCAINFYIRSLSRTHTRYHTDAVYSVLNTKHIRAHFTRTKDLCELFFQFSFLFCLHEMIPSSRSRSKLICLESETEI